MNNFVNFVPYRLKFGELKNDITALIETCSFNVTMIEILSYFFLACFIAKCRPILLR